MRTALAVLLIAVPAAASAFEISETTFEVYQTVDGEEVSETTTTVPLSFDDQTCWNWFIRSTETTGEVTFTERLVMPVAPESWGDLTDIPEGQVGPLVLEEDGKIGISTRKATLDDGWFGHGWCVLPAIPSGPHYVEISIDGEMVQRFDFEVVALPGDPPPTRDRQTQRTRRTLQPLSLPSAAAGAYRPRLSCLPIPKDFR